MAENDMDFYRTSILHPGDLFFHIPSTQSIISTILLGMLAVWLSIYHWRRRKLYILASQLEGPLALPIIGNGYQMIDPQRTLELIQKLYDDYLRNGGLPLRRLWLGPVLAVGLADLKVITAVLNQNLKKPTQYQLLGDLINRAILVNSNIPEWKAHRKAITPVFSFTILKTYIRIFHSEAAILVSKWQHRAELGTGFNPDLDLNLAMFDMVMRSTMGISVKAQDNPDHEFLYNTDRILELGIKRMFNPLLYSNLVASLLGIRGQQKAHAQVLVDFAQNTLNQIRLRIKNSEGEKEECKNESHLLLDTEAEILNPKSFAELMIEQVNGELDDELLIGEMVTIIVAGQDTTKSQNLVALLLLALHQDIQDEVLEEVDRVLGSDPTYCPNYEDLCQLELLDRVIKESLRLYPAAPIIGRLIDDVFELDNGLTLPAGVNVIIPISSIHRDPRYYPSPNQFDPSRWTPESVASRPPNCFLPFSGGPRNCIGQKYAMLQMKAVLSTILRNYRILPSDECASMEDIRFEMRVTIKMKENCKIRLQKRRF